MDETISGRSSDAHPALARFLTAADKSARILLIRAAANTGRGWFARSWIGNHQGEVHDFSASEKDISAEIESLLTNLDTDEQLRLAVILPPSFSEWARVPRTQALLAFHRDLVLESNELEIVLQKHQTAGGYSVQQIWELCGGWLGPATVLAKAPQGYDQARRMLGNSLTHWLAYQDPEGTLSEIAFLTKIDEPAVEAFFGEISSSVHSLGELMEAALVQPAGQRAWMMPSMVRKLLIEATQRLAPARVRILERAAITVLAATEGLEKAADTAIEHRRWPALLDLLTKHWTDLFFNNPQQLAAITTKVPRFLSDQTMHLQVALRMLAFTGKDGMDLQLPAWGPDYDTDTIAQRLYQDTERLYKKPDARALTIGMLELFHLRLRGLFREGGASALRLRKAVSRAVDERHINPGMVAFAELQAGISLQLAGNDIDARLAYENSLHWAQRSSKNLLLADGSGKLALLHALEGNIVAARHWLEKHERAFEHLKWGRRSIAHTAALARGFVALSAADFESVEIALDTLPQLPDNEEFWAAHAYLIALQRINDQVPDSARTLIEALRSERRYAAASPMAESLLDDAWVLATARQSASNGSGTVTASADPTLQAFVLLLHGYPDAALSMMSKTGKLPSGVRRRHNLALYLDMAIRNPAGPTPALQERIERLHRDSGSLAEIAMLMMVPGWTELAGLLKLDPEERRRLENAESRITVTVAGRPVLTTREDEILGQLRQGMTRREIAQSGFRSENTIKTQMRSLYRKFEASDMNQVLERARLWGL